MGLGLITITKTFGSASWTNVHGFRVTDDGPLSVEDMVVAGVNDIITADTTDVRGNSLSLAGVKLLHTVISWERQILDDNVFITRIYVSDGLKPAPGENSQFFTVDVNLPGLVNIGIGTSLASGPIILQVNKNPAVFSRRVGRGFFRAALADTEIAFGGEKLITWRSTQAEANVRERVAVATTESNLYGYLGLSPLSSIWYGIPQYQGRCEPTPGALRSFIPITSLEAVRPSIRSVSRRKRSTPEACDITLG